MNLAEEIRKLSDHLMMLAEINKKIESGEITPTATPQPESVKEPKFPTYTHSQQ